MSEEEELDYHTAIQKAGKQLCRFPLVTVRGREKRNILYLFYEDMKENPRREVERIMRYLGLSLSDEVISQIVELTSFKSMKENPMSNYSCVPKLVFDDSISPFMRKGEVGDWRNHFTPEQSKMFDKDYKEKMKDVDIPFRDLI
uniref:Sulfotransferase n=1 Tax=Periophthalmus magnuspinnatus TaxID=409849 RepID=A0A3B4ANY3_9GOBI